MTHVPFTAPRFPCVKVDVGTMEETVVEATRVGLLDAKMDALVKGRDQFIGQS